MYQLEILLKEKINKLKYIVLNYDSNENKISQKLTDISIGITGSTIYVFEKGHAISIEIFLKNLEYCASTNLPILDEYEIDKNIVTRSNIFNSNTIIEIKNIIKIYKV